MHWSAYFITKWLLLVRVLFHTLWYHLCLFFDYQNHHKASVHQQDVPFVHFDYHAEIKGSNLKNLENLKTKLAKNLKEFDIFFVADINSGEAQRYTFLLLFCSSWVDSLYMTLTLLIFLILMIFIICYLVVILVSVFLPEV